MGKSLDKKLASIHADPIGSRDFIICDAKDQDMAFGIAAPGKYPSHEAPHHDFAYRSVEEFRDQIRQIIAQGEVDIVLMSNSTSHQLVFEEKLFEGSHVTPAVRANDTTDIFVVRGGDYPRVASRPFRTTTLNHIQCGKFECAPDERIGPDLGLYSITFNNDRDRDLEALQTYRDFRIEAEASGFRHFLELFTPNVDGAVDPAELGNFINDHIVRTLAGVPPSSRPIFLKTVYLGARAMEALARYDSQMIVGVLGGSAGTTFDAFDLLYQARKHGARAALFGRKINSAEHQPGFVKFLRMIAEGEIEPGEAVKAYHGVLEKLGIKPNRPLKDDIQATVDLTRGDEASGASIIVPESGYGGSGSESDSPDIGPTPIPSYSSGSSAQDHDPDFSTMTPEEKIQYQRDRWNRILG